MTTQNDNTAVVYNDCGTLLSWRQQATLQPCPLTVVLSCLVMDVSVSSSEDTWMHSIVSKPVLLSSHPPMANGIDLVTADNCNQIPSLDIEVRSISPLLDGWIPYNDGIGASNSFHSATNDNDGLCYCIILTWMSTMVTHIHTSLCCATTTGCDVSVQTRCNTY